MMQEQSEIAITYKRAMLRISGGQGAPTQTDFANTVADLREIMPTYPAAKAKLAVLTQLGAGTPQDPPLSDTLFLEAAMSGMPPLLRELGVLVLMSGQADGLGGMLLKRAVAGGDWIAAFLILREAGRGRVFVPKDQLLKLAHQLSDNVPFKSQILLSIKGLDQHVESIPDLGFDKALCENILKASRHTNTVQGMNLHKASPNVKSLTKVLCPLACDYLIAMSLQILQPSKVVDAQKQDSVEANFRTSDGAVFLPHSLDKPLLNILRKLSNAADVDPKNGEFLALLRYHTGQEYRPHHDYLEADAKDYSRVKQCGQRCATLLTYLNTDYRGGETEFPNLDINYKGEAGDCLYFTNTDTNGTPVVDSLHAGRPVSSGEKWLVTLWIREKPFWPW